MKQILTREEEEILQRICKKHCVNPDHLRMLLMIEEEYSSKNAARGTACQKELMKRIELWAK